jgi:propionate CoA-transferase
VDEDGNATLEREPNSMAVLPQAMAVTAAGGTVVLQAERVARRGSVHPRHVTVPGIFVDDVVVAPDQMDHLPYQPAWTGDLQVPRPPAQDAELDAGAVVARRAALELRPDTLVVLGMGLAAGVPAVAWEEGIADQLTFNVEHGPVGGVPGDRRRFGTAVNMTSFLDPSLIFDMYAAGRHDVAMLGMGEVDREGNVNVAFVNGRYNIGGFLDIVHAASTLVFCGTFTAGGLTVRAGDGELRIVREGRARKWVRDVAHRSFDGAAAMRKGQRVRYVTERAVFELVDGVVTLTEVAPGMDVERDVLRHMDFVPAIASPLETMDAAVLRAGPMGLDGRNGFTPVPATDRPSGKAVASHSAFVSRVPIERSRAVSQCRTPGTHNP